ncbi:fungal hydrophobin-domain-containing protein [Boeremia exigua]|uniref:fungal hydrophobin-domain-containing protein n=1 Tax=Boeremia exigua TaxID=749465 RepID=UPI001E8DE681|nr:fungal hydrophobin-domain-containing protein [Boeremia exigua]KAH6643598.1 fungal hydrophobin-domain-containing protein [Boeremia exigua]
MQYLTILALAAAAFAAPLEERQAGLCASGTPQCCATDVLGIAVLNCAAPNPSPTGINDFIDVCAAGGQQAKCCLLPILDQALICSDVVPQAEAPAVAA